MKLQFGLHLALLVWGEMASAEPFGRDDIVTDPRPEQFSVCHGHGCARLDFLSISSKEWTGLRSPFASPARDAVEERDRITKYIARMELLVGPRTGTQDDLGGTFPGMGKPGQIDCIDESINTTLYLRMLDAEGLLHHHRIGKRATRGFFLFGWPHTTAVVVELKGGTAFAVDSWFEDNGSPPHIVPLEEWRRGWNPDRELPEPRPGR